MDDGGIHHRALLQQQALLSQVLLHCLENLLCQLVPFSKMAECQDGGGSGMLSLGNRWETPFWLSPGFSKALL